MYTKALLFAILALVCILPLSCTHDTPKAPSEKAKIHLLAKLDTLQSITADQLLRLATTGSEDSIRFAFKQTRQAYKQVELFTEYYAPSASKALNGAPLPEIEAVESTVFEPSGLQVIEEHLYPSFEEANRDELIREVRKFISLTGRVRSILDGTGFTDAHVLNACKQEVFRVMVLGITGFDTPLSSNGVQEASVALASVKTVLSLFGENEELQNLLHKAIVYTARSGSFDGFDRMAFILGYANPITTEIVLWQQQLGIPILETPLPIAARAATLFDKNGVHPDFFSGSAEAATTPEKVDLGKALFFSTVVSGNTNTCASCHQPELAFTDGLPKSAALEKGVFVQRNAPTLLYAGLQHAQFYDMRSATLESQAVEVMRNKDEMHTSVEEAALRLNRQAAFVEAFQKAFPGMEAEIQPKHVLSALASFVRSLIPFNSRFDRHMRGEEGQLAEQEIKGFNLFMGKAKCATCHFMPVFNGTAAPAFDHTESEVIGVLQNPKATHPTLDSDEGRFKHTGIKELRFAFKTPTLRNIDKTAPYMHNGAYETLEEVMDFYNNGGAQGMGLQLDNQTLPSDSLLLTDTEIKSIIAFLKSLTDEEEMEEK